MTAKNSLFDSEFGCNAKVDAEAILNVVSKGHSFLAQDNCNHFLDSSKVVSTIDTVVAMSEDYEIFCEYSFYHSLNDLICQGVTPIFSLVSIGVPKDSFSCFKLISQTVSYLFKANGIELVNMHSYFCERPTLTITLSGLYENRSECSDEFSLILSKPICGSYSFLDNTASILTHESLSLLPITKEYGNSATTDISGFSLSGHLVAVASKYCLSLQVNVSSDFIIGKAEMNCSVISNLRSFSQMIDFSCDEHFLPYLFAGQTNGPIVFFVSKKREKELIHRLHAREDANKSLL